MKDSKGIEIDAGDLIMVTIDTPVEFPATKVVFKAVETRVVNLVVKDGEEVTRTTQEVDDIIYYPISAEGLEVAKADNGNGPATPHRTDKFTFTNINSQHVLILDENNLRGHEKTLYEDIIAEL